MLELVKEHGCRNILGNYGWKIGIRLIDGGNRMKMVDDEIIKMLQEKVAKGELPPIYAMPDAVEAMIEHDEKVKQQKGWIEKYPLIKTGKVPIENFNDKELPKLSKKAVDYGFQILLIQLVAELDITNENIVEYCDLWKEIRTKSGRFLIENSYLNFKESHLGKSIVHDLKHFADMMISIVWTLSQEDVVTKVEIDGIGKYLKNKKSLGCFSEYVDFLTVLNEMDNTQKHAVTNQMGMLIGRDEPCFHCIDSNHNKDIWHVGVKNVSVAQTIEQFNSFYKFSMDKISELCS